MFNPPIDFDRRWAREEAREHPGRTFEQARELWAQAAKSAEICGGCFRPLAPTDSVTMQWRKIGKHYWVRIPVCLFCTLDDINESFFARHYRRTRCLNCGRPLRLRSTDPSLNARSCCADCKRLAKNQRNKLRRRVKHAPITCIECGRSFIPKRDDAVTCSNRCRQAQHRERARAGSGGVKHPLRKKHKQLPLGWRRQPLSDCPLCEGKGEIWINLYDCSGSKENTEPLRASCPCVQMPRPRGTDRREFRRQLWKERNAMLRVERRGARRECAR